MGGLKLTKKQKEDIKAITKKSVKICVNNFSKKINKLKTDKDFKLENKVRKHNMPTHIMYKLLNEDGETYILGKSGINYEFLVETDREDFAYGIYYGCRCILNTDRDVVKQVRQCNKEWKYLKPQILAALNNTFADVDFSERTIPTDNVSRMTYWPFWIRLGENEDVKDVAAVATRIIRNVYREFLKQENDENYEKSLDSKPSHKESTPKVETRFTNKAYDSIIKELNSNKGNLWNENAVNLFKKFLRILEKEGIIERHKIYEKAWKIKNWSNIDFAELIAEFSKKIRKIDSSKKDKITWQLFTPIIISADGKTLKDTRKQYSEKKSKESDEPNNKEDEINAIINEVFS